MKPTIIRHLILSTTAGWLGYMRKGFVRAQTALAFSLVLLSLQSCNNRVTQSLKEEADQTAEEVAELKENVQKLEQILQKQMASQNELLESAEKLASKIRQLESHDDKLEAANSKTTSSIAEVTSEVNQIKTSITETYNLIQQINSADQKALEQMQARQRQIEAASLPIKQRIANLSKQRDGHVINITDLKNQISELYQKREGVSDSVHAASIWNMLPELKQSEAILAGRIEEYRRSIQAIDEAIQAERAKLVEISL